MKKKPILDSKAITVLLKRYVRHKSNYELRNRIVELSIPLIDAAISRMRLFKYRDDIKQECALKVMQAVGKFDIVRGDAFGFLWTVICNTCRTHAERLGRPNLSLSSDENIQREAEINSHALFQTPENQHVITTIQEQLAKALNNPSSFKAAKTGLHRKACRHLKRFISSGELFFDKNAVVRDLKKIGLARKDIAYYYQYSLVVVRSQLLKAKENSSAISHTKIGKGIPSIADSGDP